MKKLTALFFLLTHIAHHMPLLPAAALSAADEQPTEQALSYEEQMRTPTRLKYTLSKKFGPHVTANIGTFIPHEDGAFLVLKDRSNRTKLLPVTDIAYVTIQEKSYITPLKKWLPIDLYRCGTHNGITERLQVFNHPNHLRTVTHLIHNTYDCDELRRLTSAPTEALNAQHCVDVNHLNRHLLLSNSFLFIKRENWPPCTCPDNQVTAHLINYRNILTCKSQADEK